MPTQRVNDRNRDRMDADEPGFAEARRQLAEARAEHQAEAEEHGERTHEEPASGAHAGRPAREAGSRSHEQGPAAAKD